MNILSFDWECSTSNKGNPFDTTNVPVCLCVKWLMGDNSWKPTVFFDDFSSIQEIVNRADLLVAFNAKFDLHWLRKIGVDFSNKRIWDCQIGEYILNNQKTPYPSLDQAAEKYGLHKKLDVVKLEYWDKGIDTPDIPREILSDYCSHDVELTEQVYLKQRELFETDKRYALFKLQCQDLLVLEEMEWNGIIFASQDAADKAADIEQQLSVLHKKLISLVGDIPFNLNSGDHVSCILYGGTIYIDDRIPVGVFKSGQKVGETRYKIITVDYVMPRLCEPIKGTEIKGKPVGSQPYWQTNEDILKKIKLNPKSKKIVDLIQEYTKLEKLRGTYLLGWGKLINNMNWEKNMIHGNLNQCVAVTGRLSSTKPNLQNADVITQKYCISRYV